MEYRESIGDSNISFQTALVMIAALFEGPDIAKIAEVTGCPRETVDRIAARLTASGLWKDDRTDYQEWDPTTRILGARQE
jgi:DNA-binding IclR family transcriptional regulator